MASRNRNRNSIIDEPKDIRDSSKKDVSSIAELPRVEIVVYAIIACVFFICYPMYKIYEESQASVYELNYDLADGYGSFGRLRDVADFEWNFWKELITLKEIVAVFVYIGVVRLVEIYLPKWRNSFIMVFSIASIAMLTSWMCMLLLLCNATFMFIVSLSKKTFMIWAAALFQIFTISNPYLTSFLSKLMDNQYQYNLMIFSVALCNLRFLSFALDRCQSSDRCQSNTGFGFMEYLLYVFYLPLFFFGPLMTYKDFHQQIQKKTERLSWKQYQKITKELVHYIVCIIVIEIALHFVYFAAFHQKSRLLNSLPLWALGGNALCHTLFFQLKYEVMFGIPRIIALLDHVSCPRPPVCVIAIYRFIDMWRYFDRGLHSILLNYIYIPLGGSRNGIVRQILASLVAFLFVFYWHGLESHIFYWAAFNWLGVAVETVTIKLRNTQRVKAFIFKCNLTAASCRRFTALAYVPDYIALGLSNLLFLSGIDMGYLYFERFIIKSFPTGPFVFLLIVYCLIQVIMEFHRQFGKKYLCEKRYQD